jgi:hypothetical protein
MECLIDTYELGTIYCIFCELLVMSHLKSVRKSAVCSQTASGPYLHLLSYLTKTSLTCTAFELRLTSSFQRLAI